MRLPGNDLLLLMIKFIIMDKNKINTLSSESFSISLKPRSGKSDFACPDGEVAGVANLRFSAGTLVPCQHDSPDRLPPSEDSPFRDGMLQRPPLCRVEFALRKSILEGWHIHPDQLPSKIVNSPNVGKDVVPVESDWGNVAAALVDDFEADCKGSNLFSQPFFALSAYRLADGSHFCPSPPMLMIPNSRSFMVEGSSDFSVPTMKMSVLGAVCRLQWRVTAPALPENWRNVVTHLDIFISDAISLRDIKAGAKGYHRVECDNFTHCIDEEGVAGEHTVSSGMIVQGWKMAAVDDAIVARSVMHTDSFHLISEIPIENVVTSAEFADVAFNRGGLSILSSLETFTPDFAHLAEVGTAGHASFSGRVTAWNLTVTPPSPYPPHLVAPYSNDSVSFPRWIFHPDPDCRKFCLPSGGRKYAVAMRRHPVLMGSFYWGGFGQSASENFREIDSQDIPDDTHVVNLPGSIWRSQKGSRRLFPDSLLMHLHVGEVIAVCRAFRASGLVATTSPTAYAFTTEGVFLLKEMDDGTFRDAGLICAYRLRDAGSLELLPKGVRFVTVDGEVVVMEGTKVTLSEDVESVGDKDYSWKDFIPEEWNIEGGGFSPNGGWCAFVTRPIKLSGAEDWKQLRRVALHGLFDKDKVSMAVYCSADLCCWHKTVVADRSRIEGLWSPRSRYFRIAVKANLSAGHSLQALVCEFKM